MLGATLARQSTIAKPRKGGYAKEFLATLRHWNGSLIGFIIYHYVTKIHKFYRDPIKSGYNKRIQRLSLFRSQKESQSDPVDATGGEKSNSMPIYFLEFDPWKRVRGTNPARFVERRKLVSLLFYTGITRLQPVQQQPAGDILPRIRAPLPRAPLVNKSARTTRVASQRLRFLCNVCNGVSRKGEGGESDLVDINRIRERWLDATGLFSIMTKISPVLDTKSVPAFFPFLLVLFLFHPTLSRRERERESYSTKKKHGRQYLR